jgi:hypothetical protein
MPTNEEIDDLLKQLAIAAKNHQSRTLGRQQAMTKLITEIEIYQNINCPQTTNFYSETYQEFCAKAQHNLMLHICIKIHNYRPEKEVFTVNLLRFTYAADEDF